MVSVVINLYNGASYVGECLDSVLALEGGYQLQVIVVDDASTDNGEAILHSYNDPRIEYVRLDRNVGAAAAINHAFTLVHGEFMARIDYDDRYRPDFLVRSMAALERYPEAAFVCGSAMMIDAEGVPSMVVGPGDFGERPGCQDRFGNLLACHFVTAPTILARTSHWRRAIPIPEGLNFCDWYMNLIMAEAAPVAVIEAVTAEYRVHPLNMHSTIIRSGVGEAITFKVLNRFLFESSRSAEVARRATGILGRHRAEWGDNYFAAGMQSDALRCYVAALRHDAGLAWRGRFLHRALGAVIGRRAYSRFKTMVLGA